MENLDVAELLPERLDIIFRETDEAAPDLGGVGRRVLLVILVGSMISMPMRISAIRYDVDLVFALATGTPAQLTCLFDCVDPRMCLPSP